MKPKTLPLIDTDDTDLKKAKTFETLGERSGRSFPSGTGKVLLFPITRDHGDYVRSPDFDLCPAIGLLSFAIDPAI
jgi:hypothetical protein